MVDVAGVKNAPIGSTRRDTYGKRRRQPIELCGTPIGRSIGLVIELFGIYGTPPIDRREEGGQEIGMRRIENQNAQELSMFVRNSKITAGLDGLSPKRLGTTD